MTGPAKKRARRTPEAHWNLRLYVAGLSPRSAAAIGNLRRICEQYLVGKYSVEVIDLLENPELARTDQIVAIPTLVRKLPPPIRKIIGDLSNREKVIAGLNIEVRGSEHETVSATEPA